MTLDDSPPEDDEGPPRAQEVPFEEPGYEFVEALASIESASPSLPPIERTVLGMRFGQELSHREIARRLEISVGSAARLLEDALGRLSPADGDEGAQSGHRLGAPGRGLRSSAAMRGEPGRSRGDLATAALS